VEEIIKLRLIKYYDMNNILDDLELELERILLEKSDVQNILLNMERMCSNYEEEKEKLQEELKKVLSIIYLSAITCSFDIISIR